MSLTRDHRDQEAQDAFWWLVLEELRAGVRVHTVELRMEEDRDPPMGLAPLRLTRPSHAAEFMIEGRVSSAVRPFPPAVSSIEDIRELLNSWMDERPSSPSAPTPNPPPQVDPPVSDDSSVRFSLMELA